MLGFFGRFQSHLDHSFERLGVGVHELVKTLLAFGDGRGYPGDLQGGPDFHHDGNISVGYISHRISLSSPRADGDCSCVYSRRPARIGHEKGEEMNEEQAREIINELKAIRQLLALYLEEPAFLQDDGSQVFLTELKVRQIERRALVLRKIRAQPHPESPRAEAPRTPDIVTSIPCATRNESRSSCPESQ